MGYLSTYTKCKDFWYEFEEQTEKSTDRQTAYIGKVFCVVTEKLPSVRNLS